MPPTPTSSARPASAASAARRVDTVWPACRIERGARGGRQAAGSEGPVHFVPDRGGGDPGGQRGVVRGAAADHGRRGRRERLRQVGHRPRAAQHRAAAGAHRRRPGAVPRRRRRRRAGRPAVDGAQGRGHPPLPRQAHRDDLPGSDDLPEPRAHRGQPDCRVDPYPRPRRVGGRGARAGGGTADRGRDPQPGGTPGLLLVRAQRRHRGHARADGGGAGRGAGAADRGRAPPPPSTSPSRPSSWT